MILMNQILSGRMIYLKALFQNVNTVSVNMIFYDTIWGSTPSFSFDEVTNDEALKKLRKVII